jgi:HAMP domain-containing protein
MKFLYSITFRVTLWYLAILSIMLVLLGCGIYVTLSNRLYHNLDLSLRERSEHIGEFRDVLSIIAGGTFEDQTGEYITFYYYADERLHHIAPRGNIFPVTEKLIDHALSGKKLFENIDIPEKGLFRVLISPFTPNNPVIIPDQFRGRRQQPDRERWRDGGFNPPPRRDDRPNRPPPPDHEKRYERRMEIKSAVLVIARPTKDIEIVLSQLLRIIVIAIPLTLFLAGGGGIFLAHRALRPVKYISDTARQIEEKDLSRRIDVRTKDELGFLAETLNQMIERLENAFKRQKGIHQRCIT